MSTAENASDEELRGTLAHEFGHLLATYPRWTFHRGSIREGLFFLTGMTAVLFALAFDTSKAPTWAWAITIGLSLLVGLQLVESLAYARWRRRL